MKPTDRPLPVAAKTHLVEARVACLKAAIEIRSQASSPEALLATAQQFFAWVRGDAAENRD